MIIPRISIFINLSFRMNTERKELKITVKELALASNIWLPNIKAVVFKILPIINEVKPSDQNGSQIACFFMSLCATLLKAIFIKINERAVKKQPNI